MISRATNPPTRLRGVRHTRRLGARYVFAVMLGSAAATAYDAVSAATAPPAAALPIAPSSEADDAAAMALGRKLRCPVCQGMPIAESPATMAVDMMQRIRQMQAAGSSDAAIMTYFTTRYGEWVLLDPPRTGFSLWVWLLPPFVLMGLLVLGARMLLRRIQSVEDALPHSQAASASALLAVVRQEVDQ